MTYTTLSGTDLEISRIILGSWTFAGGMNWGDQSDKQSIRAIHAAADHGITTIDTALGYGDGKAQQVVGKAVSDRREKYIILDKIPETMAGYEGSINAAEQCLKNLGTDYIDLLQLHWDNPDVPVEETLRAALKLRQDGKIRHFGVCNFGVEQMRRLDAVGELTIASNQLPYSLLARSIEYEIQPECERRGLSMLAYSPIAQGLLAGKFDNADQVPEGRARTRHFSNDRPNARHGEPGCEEETFGAIARIADICQSRNVSMSAVALSWVLHQPMLAAAIVGARNDEQTAHNAAAADLKLDDQMIQSLDAATEVVKERLGRNADLWQSGDSTRIR
ncbi:MAG: aldo/keto reductase [Spirochaetales bacterium]